jgi:transposase
VLACTLVRRILRDRPVLEFEPGSLTAPSLVTAAAKASLPRRCVSRFKECFYSAVSLTCRHSPFLAGVAMTASSTQTTTRSTKAKTTKTVQPTQDAAADKPKAKRTRGEKNQAQQQHQQRRHAKQKQRAAVLAEDARQAQAQAEAVEQAEAQTKMATLPVVNRHAAGSDIGSRSHWVCIDADGDEATCVREFPTHTEGLKEILAWLLENHVTTVAMESTGVYWIPLYELLESAGIEVILVDPSYTKQVKGRPKTDRLDCKWIQRLHALGMLAAAFRPDEKICVLRNYLRQRANLIRSCSMHVQHMQKALEQMNLKLTEVISDITGTTGLAILKAILRGVRDPLKLAKLRDPRCKNSQSAIAQALAGSYRDEHLFALRQAFDVWQFNRKQLRQLDEVIEKYLATLKKDKELPQLPSRTKAYKRKENDPDFDVRAAVFYVAGVDLTAIEGIADLTALTLISEIGTDMSHWASVKHFTSWLGLCPQHKKTGGKVKSSRTRPGSNRAAQALRLAANALARSKSGLGAFFRRMKSRMGAAKAITAAAHKLARLVYWMLKHGTAYAKQTQEQYEAQQREKQIRNLKKRARQLGLAISEIEKPAEVKSAETITAGQ